jgi:hypothetical protein
MSSFALSQRTSHTQIAVIYIKQLGLISFAVNALRFNRRSQIILSAGEYRTLVTAYAARQPRTHTCSISCLQYGCKLCCLLINTLEVNSTPLILCNSQDIEHVKPRVKKWTRSHEINYGNGISNTSDTMVIPSHASITLNVTNYTLKSSIFWYITPCSPLKVNGRFGGEYRLRLQCRRVRDLTIQTTVNFNGLICILPVLSL